MKKSLLVLGLLPLLVACNRPNTSSEKPADSTPKQSENEASTSKETDKTTETSKQPEEPGTFVIEAEFSPDIEYADEYPGFSGSQSGANIIVQDRDGSFGASNGYYVSYLYKRGASLSYTITSDKDVEVELYWRISGEFFNNQTYNMTDNEITVNENMVVYSRITLDDIPGQGQNKNRPFTDVKLNKVKLHAGNNTLVYTTQNETKLGGTMSATAPIIDCFKIKNYQDAKLEFSDAKTDYEVF